MDDASGTFFSALLTVIAVVVIFTVSLAALPFLIVGFALYLLACFVWGLLSPGPPRP
jgi:hypothetical protein